MSHGELGSSVLGEGGGVSPEGANILLPPTAKRVKLITFSGPRRSFVLRRKIAIKPTQDCKQRGMRREALSESHHSLPQGNPADVSDILDNPEKNLVYLNNLEKRWFPDYREY